MELNYVSIVLILTLSVLGIGCTNRKSQNERTLDEVKITKKVNNKIIRSLLSPYNITERSQRKGRSARSEYAFPYYNDYNYYPRSAPPPQPTYYNPYPPPHHQYPSGPLHPHNPQEKENKKHGIHAAGWNWERVGVFFTFTVFIVVTGLAKVGKLCNIPHFKHKSLKKIFFKNDFS